MSYGYAITLDNGRSISSDKYGGSTIADAFIVPPGASGGKTYPDLAGLQIVTSEIAYSATGIQCAVIQIDYDLGYPRLNYSYPTVPAPATGATTYILVFAL